MVMRGKPVNQDVAIAIDQHLMGDEVGYSVDQLMELAGQAVARAVSCCADTMEPVAVFAGPGNNGGDGLVAARHLAQYGYNVTVYYPAEPKNDLMKRLVLQLNNHKVEINKTLPTTDEELDKYPVMVDALFGFSFKGEPKEPYGSFLSLLATHLNRKKSSQCFAVDIPSGWSVDEGPSEGCAYMPRHLISLTVPKMCATKFVGTHWLGGRFVPQSTVEKFNLDIPPYPGTELVMQISPQRC